MDTLHVVKRQDGRITEDHRELPDDREQREAIIRQTLEDLANGEGQISA
jgi:hypothetical protein